MMRKKFGVVTDVGRRRHDDSKGIVFEDADEEGTDERSKAVSDSANDDSVTSRKRVLRKSWQVAS